jgi:hypothetical protein
VTFFSALASKRTTVRNASNSGGFKPLKSRWTNYSFAATAALVLSVVAIGGQQPKAKTVKGGESGLVGIKLYDTGTRVISVYGNPTEILPVSFGGGTIGPGAGGGRGGPGPGGGRGGPGPAGPAAPVMPNSPGFGFGDEILRTQQGAGTGGIGLSPTPGDEGGGGMGPGGPGGGGGGGVAGSTGGKILYTRWVYKRGPSKYGFIMDKFNRVVQCEAIGMNDGRVRTSKGIHFGSSFGEVIKAYQTPDGYEINGDNIVVRYLVRNKVAFRLSRLGDKKPHVVTGIVVAGGKT